MGESAQILRQWQGSRVVSIPLAPTHSYSCNTVSPAKLNQNKKIQNALKIFPSSSPFPHNSVFPSVLPFASFPSPLYSLLSFLSQDIAEGLLHFKYFGVTRVHQIHSLPFQGSQSSGEEKKFIVTTQHFTKHFLTQGRELLSPFYKQRN